MKTLNTSTISLSFLGRDDPGLEKVLFLYDSELGEITSSRGRSTFENHHNFPWTPAVRAVSLILLAAARGERGTISGEDKSLASSLDYALSKNTSWLSDMFGCDKDGVPIARQIFRRSNAERKRPGPVIISLNSSIVSNCSVTVFLDDKEITKADDIRTIANRIESNFLNAKRIPSGPKTDPIVPIAEDVGISRQGEFQIDEPVNSSDPDVVTTHFLTALDLETEYLDALRRRQIGIKFTAVGKDGVRAWQDRSETKSYLFFQRSLELVRSSVPKLLTHLPDKFGYLAVYPGTGLKEGELARTLSEKRQVNYALIDSSYDLALIAAKRVRIPSHIFVADPARPGMLPSIASRMRGVGDDPLLFSFIGNTLGVSRQADFLHKIRSALTAKDLVYLDVQCTDSSTGETEDDRLRSFAVQYDSDSNQRQFLSALSHCGLTLDEGYLESETRKDLFLPELWVLEYFFRFKKNVTVNYNGETLPFMKGERILLNWRYLYTQEIFERIIKTHGFQFLETFTPSGGLIGALIRKIN